MTGDARTEHVVYLGLGSNLGDPAANLDRALRQLTKLPHSRLVTCSDYYRNPPLGPVPQPDYVNAVCRLDTHLQPLPLLRLLQALELNCGRVRDGTHWGPRILDVDILLYDDRIISEPELVIPHPGLTVRNFVLVPLLEIAPDLKVPGQGLLSNLVRSVTAETLVRIDKTTHRGR